MLGTQRPHQRVLHDIVGRLGVAGQRTRVTPQRRNCRLDLLAGIHSSMRTSLAKSRFDMRYDNDPTALRRIPSHCRCRLRLAGARLMAATGLCHRRPAGGVSRQAEGSGNAGKSRASCAANAAWSWGSPTTARSAGASPRPAAAHGAELAFTYQGDALKKRVEPLAQEIGGIVVGDCDVTEPADHRRGVRRACKRPGAASISWSTPSRSPTRISSTAAMSTPRPTISPRPC